MRCRNSVNNSWLMYWLTRTIWDNSAPKNDEQISCSRDARTPEKDRTAVKIDNVVLIMVHAYNRMSSSGQFLRKFHMAIASSLLFEKGSSGKHFDIGGRLKINTVSFQESYNTPREHTPGNSPSQLCHTQIRQVRTPPIASCPGDPYKMQN